ncbi:MAG: DNA protecting protein DprA [Parcubacteria bacterium C7867-001]|nr:MAG: DNA protecting protein DprA [Parcubacteria bacterium C7867-001]
MVHTIPMDTVELGTTGYPKSLAEIPGAPKKLWMRGVWPAAGTKRLAVVGSRALSSYGREACHKLISGLAGYPISIISGLALGTDAEAHRAALKAGLHTIAVPGSGLGDSAIYPRTNVGLAKDILKADGLLLSEHPEDYKPAAYDFPSRNRIMVGLADAILVIEAGEKSGTLITARLAHEYNRDLLCVPHRIGDPHGFGANLFIRLGAGLVAESSHILEALGIDPRAEGARADIKLEGNERIIYELLDEPVPKDELIRASRLTPSDALSALVMLELKGVLKEEFGAWRRT